jgi:hypothetical protein
VGDRSAPRLVEGKKLCFGRKYSEKRGGPCRGWQGSKACADKDDCKQLYLVRLQTGIKDAEDTTVPDNWEETLVVVSGPSKSLIHAGEANSPSATTITHAEIEEANDKILAVEKLAVGQTLRYFCALGTLYGSVHARMAWREFRGWVEKAQGRSIVTVLKYEQLARTVEAIGEDAAEQLLNRPGLTLDKFIAIVRAVGPENLLEAVDRKVTNEDGTEVPVTTLPLHRVKKELSPRQQIAEAERAMRQSAAEHDDPESPDEVSDGSGEVPDGVAKFDPMPVLVHLGDIRRRWRDNADAIRYCAITLKDRDVKQLLSYVQFLEELSTDLQRFVEAAEEVTE